MNKRAQFFLIAALIISGIILSFGKAYVVSKVEKTPVQVYDLSDQLQSMKNEKASLETSITAEAEKQALKEIVTNAG